jgi:predicted acyl esterase
MKGKVEIVDSIVLFFTCKHTINKQLKWTKNQKKHRLEAIGVATLALGSWPRQGLAKVRAKSEARESHFMLPGV